MAVIQGLNINQMRVCANELGRLPNVTAWGIPRCCTYVLGTRWGILQDIVTRNDGRRIHLLGFSENLSDDVGCSKSVRVSGIDSAVPIRWGLMGNQIDLGTTDLPKRGNYWETAHETNVHVIDNIKLVRKWLA